MVSSYTSIDTVIERINRFKIPGGDWNIEEIKEWTYEALSFMDKDYAKTPDSISLEIKNNMARIPAEIYSIRSVYNNADNKELKEVLPHRVMDESTYLIDAGYIYTSFSSGKGNLLINYYTIPLDEDDKPLIPDNPYYLKAIESYLQYMIGKRSYFQGKILERQFFMLEQEWGFYLPAAIASQKMDIMKDPKRFSRIHNKFME